MYFGPFGDRRRRHTQWIPEFTALRGGTKRKKRGGGRKGASKEKKGVQKRIGAFAGERLSKNTVKT